MQINPAQLHNQSQLMKEYRNRNDKIREFFDYDPFGDDEKRICDLKKRKFNRKQLIPALMKMNQKWGAPVETLQNIERLQDESSTVVIGGQQAGLLTGPLYTINKVISIIQLARQEEKKLNIPVIPVFWIAGEDHDYDEVNHVYMQKHNQMEKIKLDTVWNNKQPVSDLPFDRGLVREWLNTLFQGLQETEYTEDLYKDLVSCLTNSNSFTDFFARILFLLFEEEGLVLIDSGDLNVRTLEQNYFIQMIEKQPEISDGVYTAVNKLKNMGYSLTLDAEKTDGHLFFHYNGERILLIRNAERNWIGKQGEVVLSTEELMETAKTNPHLLSNNVVTRPLMQELLFPTIAFIGGPGEIAYWAGLKNAFHAIGITMPPVIPRLSITYIDRLTKKYVEKFNLDPDMLINEGATGFKKEWIQSKASPSIDELANQIKHSIDDIHKPLRELANDIRADISSLAKKNLQYLHREIDFLARKMNQAMEDKYEQELGMLNHLDLVMHPSGGLQERIWNPLPFLNEYGMEWIKKTVRQPLSFKEDHYLVYM